MPQRSRAIWVWRALAVVSFAAALVVASRIQGDFDKEPNRTAIEAIATIVLAAPLLTMLRWRLFR